MARIAERRAITIVRATDRAAGLDRCRRLIEAGADVIEVSFTTPDAAALIAELVEAAGSTALVGAGTVLDGATARAAVDAGAQFLLAPGLAPEMVRAGQRAGVAVIPAAQTATEAMVAMEHGASAVKLFPASTVGIAGMQAITEALAAGAVHPHRRHRARHGAGVARCRGGRRRTRRRHRPSRSGRAA